MKSRIIALTLLITVILSFNTFAAPGMDDFKLAFNDEISYADVNMEISFDVNAISSKAKDIFYVDKPFAKNKKTTYDISFTTTYDDMMFDIASKYKIESKDNPEINTGVTEHYITADFSGGRPYYITILKFENTDQYIYLNMVDIPETQGYVYNLQDLILSGGHKAIFNSFPADIKTEIKNNKYTVKLDDAQIKEALKNITPVLDPMGSLSIKYTGISLDEIYSKLYPLIKDVKIFGANGLTIKTALDDNNKLDKITLTLDIDMNVYELLTALKDSIDETALDGLTKNNSQFKATLSVAIK